MKGYFSKKKRTNTATGRPCEKCGQFVERLPNGVAYNDDGSWHKDTCRPNAEWQAKEKIRRAEWEAKNLIHDEDKREVRSTNPLCKRGR